MREGLDSTQRRGDAEMCDGTFRVARVRFTIGPSAGRKLPGVCGVCRQAISAIVMSRHPDGSAKTARICWHERVAQ
jgi:hypothetical protein